MAVQELQGRFQDLPDRLARIERSDRILKDILDDLAEGTCTLPAQCRCILASNLHVPGSWLFKPDKHTGERTLPRPAFSHHGKCLALMQRKSHGVDSYNLVTPPAKQETVAAEDFGQIPNFDRVLTHDRLSGLNSGATRERNSLPCPISGTQAMSRLV